jgi:putative DNA primase/helicase
VLADAGLSDDQILEKARRSRKNGAKFAALWAGSWEGRFKSQSEADSSVVFTLAFYTKDAAQIDRMFRTSGLFRTKWDEKHGTMTYGQTTIDKALAQVTGHYQPHRRAPAPSPAPAAGDGDNHDAEGLVTLGKRDPQSKKLVLSPRKTLPTAEAFVCEFHHHPEGRTLYSYAGTLLTWRGNRYVEIEEETLRQRLQPWLHKALRYICNKRTGVLELVPFESNPGTVKAAVESLRAYAHLPVSVTPPSWLDGRAHPPDPKNLLPFPSGTLDLATGRTLPPTPALFNINAIDFDYDPSPEVPERWIKFLEQLWGDDLESVALLQEWLGYCLVADTSQQKMLLMVGPKRSGKGTIGRVLTRLVGVGNVVGPTTSSLAGSFGLQPLVGKSLAIVSDARFNGENVGVVTERLLCISGEDALTVDRKFLGSVTMKLPTRFMFLTNELPRMNDASGALAGRFVILRLTKSFYGQENTALIQELIPELPGILVWAIEGFKRLRTRGHFIQPKAVSDAVQEMEDLASPVLAFVRDCCEVGVGRRTWINDMYGAWKRWCESDGRNTNTSKPVFGRDLAAAVPGVVCRRHNIQGRFYDGIALRAGGAT